MSVEDIAKKVPATEQAIKCSCLRLYKAGLIERTPRKKKTHLGNRVTYIYRLPV